MLIYILYHNIIWGCIISALIGGAAVALFFILKNREKKSVSEMKPSMKRDIMLGLIDNPGYFADLYEPLYLLANGNVSKKDIVLDAWNERVAASDFSDGFKTAFAALFGNTAALGGKKKRYIKRAGELIKYIFKTGIVRSDELCTVGDEQTADKYIPVGLASVETGVTYDVLAPYWSVGDTILSKGVIR